MVNRHRESQVSEFEQLCCLTRDDLATQLKQSLSGHANLPMVHSSLVESASDVWASLFEAADPESSFRIRMTQILPKLLVELIDAKTIPDWAAPFCDLLRRIGGPQSFDALRTVLLGEAFRDEKYRPNDIDRLLLQVAETRMRTSTTFWQKLLGEERYADIAHMALSTSLRDSIRHLQTAAHALKDPRRSRALVWITLDRWLSDSGDAQALSRELRRHVNWNHAVRRIIDEWASKRDLTGFELPSPLEDHIESPRKFAEHLPPLRALGSSRLALTVNVYVLPPERDLSSTLEDRVKDFAEWLSGEEAKTPSPELFAPQLPSPLGLQDVLKLLTSVNFTLRAQTLRTLSAASHTDDDSDCRAGI